MKQILIAGSGSYIGTHLSAELSHYPEAFAARELDVRTPWPKDSFWGIDSVVIVAGIAHRKETAENRADYQRVNCDLAVQIATEAKQAGVKQVLYLSSMSVYGMNEGRITAATPLAPASAYGQSKRNAEAALTALADDRFAVAILRPPMVYGKNCPGNYGRLAALACKLPVFPYFTNERSMIYIETLCIHLRKLIEAGCGGLYFPQNESYVQTCEMMRAISECHHHRLRPIKGFGLCISLLRRFVPMAQKVFGSLTYDQSMSTPLPKEEAIPFAETIRRSEDIA